MARPLLRVCDALRSCLAVTALPLCPVPGARAACSVPPASPEPCRAGRVSGPRFLFVYHPPPEIGILRVSGSGAKGHARIIARGLLVVLLVVLELVVLRRLSKSAGCPDVRDCTRSVGFNYLL